MIDVEKVREQLAAIAGAEIAGDVRFTPLLTQAASLYESSGDVEADARLALLAAAKANYWIALSGDGNAQVTSFKAGDVSITESTDASASAWQLLQTLENDSGISGSTGFVFRTV